MPAINKQFCPTCGQSVNKREISLYKGLVSGLYRVWRYCEEHDTWTLNMKTIREVLGQVDYSRFNDWKRFEPEMVWGKRSEYNFNKGLMRQSFTGRRQVCVRMLKDPLTDTLDRVEFDYLRNVPSLVGFLDDNEQFIAQYRDRVDLEQGALL